MNDYWTVIENKTGKVICHCGDINDAIMMVNFDPHTRSYHKVKYISDQVIDVISTVDKQLPGQIGLPASKVQSLNPSTNKLPEGEGLPITV